MSAQIANVTGTGVTTILAADNTRKYVCITNNVATDVYLAVGTNPVQGKGILLSARGSQYEINRDNFCMAQIKGIGTAGTMDVCVQSW